MRGLYLTADQISPDDLRYGSMSLVTDHPHVTVKPAWLRGRWWDFLQEFWDDFVEDGLFSDLNYSMPSEAGKPDTGSLGLVATLAPGEQHTFRFILTWHFPNRRNTWTTANMENFVFDRHATPSDDHARIIRNHYAVRCANAWEVAEVVIEKWDQLYAGTRAFHDALFGSTLPPQLLDAISANIVPVRSNTCFWLEDGRFYGWEGCFDSAGCCAGSCTHVWSYAYTVAYLFPSLEREMRRIEFEIETETDGFMNFRNYKSMDELFLWTNAAAPQAAVDGQLGSILRTYREWLLSADRDWLVESMAGRQTRDWVCQRALGHRSRWRAGWETAQHLRYRVLRTQSAIQHLLSGRAARRRAVGAGDERAGNRRAQLAPRSRRAASAWTSCCGTATTTASVSTTSTRYPYQHGDGCLSDQLLGQLHAHWLGLGDLLPREHIQRAVAAIYDHNFRTDFSDHANCQRTYVLNDETGLLMCTWPRSGRPKFPFPYSDEVWTGVEYHVAAHLIAEGLTDEGLRMVQAVRDRHDGLRRNPWDEVECGHHYARSMSSWMLLLAATGFQCDASERTITFAPATALSTDKDTFSTFWSNGVAWGTFTAHREAANQPWRCTVTTLGGDVSDTRITLYGQPI